MWYPEEPVTFCRTCEIHIPYDCLWRGSGFIITGGGKQIRTTVLYSACPECGQRFSVGLDGPQWHRVVYGWLWQLRYPNTRPPEVGFGAVQTRRRRA